MDQHTYHDLFATKGIEYLLTIVFFLLIIPFWLLLNYREKIARGVKKGINYLSDKILSIPKGIMLSKNHTWTFLEKSGLATLGIDNFLMHVAGKSQFLLHKAAGETVKKGEQIATLKLNDRSLKLYSPVSGKVKKTNTMLTKNPWVIHKDPYGNGWILALEPSNWKAETQSFYFAEEARQWLTNELTRFKDFLAQTGQRALEPGMIALQDGGEIRENVLEEVPAEAWQEFQQEFLSV